MEFYFLLYDRQKSGSITLVNGNSTLFLLICGEVVIVWQLDLQLPRLSVHIITKVVSTNPAPGEMPYVIKFDIDLLQVGRWFSHGTSLSITNKTDSHDITEILLKVALNTINQTVL